MKFLGELLQSIMVLLTVESLIYLLNTLQLALKDIKIKLSTGSHLMKSTVA